VVGIDLGALADLPPDALMERSLRLHPRAALICSGYPIYSIWTAHLDATATNHLLAAVSLDHDPEDVLITKAPSGEAIVKRLRPGEAALLFALQSGSPLGSAWHAAIDADTQFDLATTLAELASVHALVD
jgi:hypothetical protein